MSTSAEVDSTQEVKSSQNVRNATASSHRMIHSLSSLSEIPNAHTPSAPILDEERVL